MYSIDFVCKCTLCVDVAAVCWFFSVGRVCYHEVYEGGTVVDILITNDGSKLLLGKQFLTARLFITSRAILIETLKGQSCHRTSML